MAGIWCLLGNTQLVYAAQQETGVEVRLTKIELRLDSLEQRITAMEHSIEQRFTAMEHSIDQRFGAIDQRFADMMFWLQIIFSTMVIGIGSLIIQWFIMWKKIVWCEAQLKLPEKDKLIDVQREEIGVLKNLVMDLQQRLTGLEGVVLKAR
ncbi:MAG: hypothetical protein AAB296_08970 [Candidatus Desantisbacteria bacterium]